jgi:hypothetical protein
MRNEDYLTTELETLRRLFGTEREESARRALAVVVRWVRETGHGDVKLSAIDHKLSPKVRFDTVVDVDGAAR